METVIKKWIVIFFGMTGSGKSYLSTAWARKHGCLRLNTDVVRKECIAGASGAQPVEKGIEKGLYTPELSRRTYEQLLELTDMALADSESPCVVVDGSFQRASERGRLVARFHGRAALFFICCRCSDNVTRSRLAMRRADPCSVSDGDLVVYLHQLAKFENPTEIPRAQLLELDTDAPLEYLIDRLEKFLAEATGDCCSRKTGDETP